jgi:predicted glycoside hydrolase/deacetylase ChbG (UPF0249 family)
MKRVALNADDFGLNELVTRGILDSLAAGAVQTVGCMSTTPLWSEHARRLREFPQVDVGLHLNLTEAPIGLSMPLKKLIVAAYRGKLPEADLKRTIALQLDAFEQARGAAPAFVDGHQHVHQLPQVRDALLAQMTQRYAKRCVIRNTVPAHWRGQKAAIIGLLGGRTLRGMAREARLPLNADFAGVYGFDDGLPYLQRLQTWLQSAKDGTLLMCHPGQVGRFDGSDPIAAARVRELLCLADRGVMRQLSETLDVQWVRFSEIAR